MCRAQIIKLPPLLLGASEPGWEKDPQGGNEGGLVERAPWANTWAAGVVLCPPAGRLPKKEGQKGEWGPQ